MNKEITLKQLEYEVYHSEKKKYEIERTTGDLRRTFQNNVFKKG